MPSSHRNSLKVVALGSAIMALSWFVEGLIDGYFEGESLAVALFEPTPHELAIRVAFLLSQALFIVYIAWTWHKREVLERSLHEAVASAHLEKEKSEAILDVLADAVSIQDTDLRVLYQNRAHRDLMGEHLGEYCYKAYQEKVDVCPGCHLVQSYSDGLPHRREASAQTLAGFKHFEILSTALRDGDGKIIAGVESVRDITPRKEAEEKILALNRELEMRAQHLSAINRDLESFSYTLSHDLKIPLTAIYGAAQILSDSYRESFDENGTFLLDQICRGGERMEELLDAMLQLAQANRGDLQIERVDLSAMAREIADSLQMLAPQRQVTFRIASAIEVDGDARLLRSVLENLLGNAWKFTHDVPQPLIVFGRASVNGGVYFVSDNGPGFSAEQAAQLFQPFRRLKQTSGIQGTGIGLATVQRIVERHGGKAWAEGQAGGGATFFITLP